MVDPDGRDIQIRLLGSSGETADATRHTLRSVPGDRPVERLLQIGADQPGDLGRTGR